MDANVLIAAMMRDSTTRRILLLGGHELHVPEYVFEEIERHREELSSRAGLTSEGFRGVLDILRAHVGEHPLGEYEEKIPEALALLENRDEKDAPYFALALALRTDGLWSEDRGLSSAGGVRVMRTRDLLIAPP